MLTTASAFFESLSTDADIDSLVGQTENLYFDAKVLRSENFSADSDKDKLAKQISGFANADGGSIIYGLVATRDAKNRDVVTATSPLADPQLVLSRIENLMGQFLQPPVEGVSTRKVLRSDGKGYVVVFVPPSDSGPHRSARDREYYRRHGSSTLPMEHYEIEEAFGRRRRPSLQLNHRLVGKGGNRNDGYHALILVGLKNVGRGLAKSPGLLLRGARISSYGINGSSAFGLTPLPTANPETVRYGGATERVIYPGDELDVTMLAHPIQVQEVPGANVGYHCHDLHIPYQIFAEEMRIVEGNIEMSRRQIREELASLKKGA